MSTAALKVEDLPHYTYDDYVQWEGRWELIKGIPFAMVPAPVMPAPAHEEARAGAPAAVAIIAGVVLLLVGVGVSVAVTVRPSPPPIPPIEPPNVPTSESLTTADLSQPTNIVAMLDEKCMGGQPQFCITAGALYEHGQSGAPVDAAKARSYYEKACAMGYQPGCSLRDKLKGRK